MSIKSTDLLAYVFLLLYGINLSCIFFFFFFFLFYGKKMVRIYPKCSDRQA